MRVKIITLVVVSSLAVFYIVFFWLNLSTPGASVHVEGGTPEIYIELQPSGKDLKPSWLGEETTHLTSVPEIPLLLVSGSSKIYLTNALVKVHGIGDWLALDTSTKKQVSGYLSAPFLILSPLFPEISGLCMPIAQQGTAIFEFEPTIHATMSILSEALPEGPQGSEDIESWIEFIQTFPFAIDAGESEWDTMILRLSSSRNTKEEQRGVYQAIVWPSGDLIEVDSKQYVLTADDKRLEGNLRLTAKNRVETRNGAPTHFLSSAIAYGLPEKAKSIYVGILLHGGANITPLVTLRAFTSLLSVTQFEGSVTIADQQIDISKADLNILGDLQLSAQKTLTQNEVTIVAEGQAFSFETGGVEQIGARLERLRPGQRQLLQGAAKALPSTLLWPFIEWLSRKKGPAKRVTKKRRMPKDS